MRFRTRVDMDQDKIKPALKRVCMAFEWYLNRYLMMLCSLSETYPLAAAILTALS